MLGPPHNRTADSVVDAWEVMHSAAATRVQEHLPQDPRTYRLGLLGLPGCGKTTALRLLAAEVVDLAYAGTAEFHSADSRLRRYIGRLFVDTDPSAALPCQFEALSTRVLVQGKVAAEAGVDEPIEAVLAHSRSLWILGLLGDDEAQTWLTSYEIGRRSVPSPSLMVLLTCQREELWRRTRQRGRARDGSVSDQYLDAFEQSLRKAMRSAVGPGCAAVELDVTHLSPAEVSQELRSLL